MVNTKIVWLKDESEIEGASVDSLKRSFLTCDGRGASFKEKVLQELLNRTRSEGVTHLKNVLALIEEHNRVADFKFEVIDSEELTKAKEFLG